MRGKAGELIARNYLKKQGASLREENWRCKSGEIDIIADEDKTLLFIEVKSGLKRHAHYPGVSLSERVRHHQYQRMCRAVHYYLHVKQGRLAKANISSFRLDLITVEFLDQQNQEHVLTHYRNVFELPESHLYSYSKTSLSTTGDRR